MHTSSHNQENIDPNHQSANAITGINVQNEMMKTLQLIQREIQDLKVEITSNNKKANNRKPKREKGKKGIDPLCLNIVVHTVLGITLARIIHLRQKAIRMKQCVRIGWEAVTNTVSLSMNKVLVRRS